MDLELKICGGTIITESGVQRADLGIANGALVEVSPAIVDRSKATISAEGLLIFPGLIDAHVHFNEPGRADWEGIFTGSQALAAGGGTCFVDMPLNSAPPTLDGPSFDAKKLACESQSLTDFALWGGLTPQNLSHLPELAAKGVIGFKAFMCDSGMHDFPHCDDKSLIQGMQVAFDLGLPVAVHAESNAMTADLTNLVRIEGKQTAEDYLRTRPLEAELNAIQKAILFAAETGCSLHIVHISHPQAVILARTLAKQYAVDLSCETCPHYLLLNSDDMLQMGAAAKCAPPLREESARRALVEAVMRGDFDTIGSDHSPSLPSMKQAASFLDAWGGISGIQLSLRALLTLGISHSLIAKMMASQVARRFRLPQKGSLHVGMDADFAIVEPTVRQPLERSELLDRHRFSPYLGRTFQGKIVSTYLRGKRLYDQGRVVEEARGKAKLLRPEMRA
jgi:allantoinase